MGKGLISSDVCIGSGQNRPKVVKKGSKSDPIFEPFWPKWVKNGVPFLTPPEPYRPIQTGFYGGLGQKGSKRGQNRVSFWAKKGPKMTTFRGVMAENDTQKQPRKTVIFNVLVGIWPPKRCPAGRGILSQNPSRRGSQETPFLRGPERFWPGLARPGQKGSIQAVFHVYLSKDLPVVARPAQDPQKGVKKHPFFGSEPVWSPFGRYGPVLASRG